MQSIGNRDRRELKHLIRSILDDGVPTVAIMDVVAEVLSEKTGVVLRVNDVISLLGTCPLMNERPEYVVATGVAREIGVSPPTGFVDMTEGAAEFGDTLGDALESGDSETSLSARKALVFSALEKAQGIVKPKYCGDGVDLFAVKFEHNKKCNTGQLHFHLYQVKDTMHTFPDGKIKIAGEKLFDGEASVEHIFGDKYQPLLDNGVLKSVTFSFTLVINGARGVNAYLGSVYRNRKTKKECEIISGDETIALMFEKKKQQAFYRKQLRRRADEHD